MCHAGFSGDACEIVNCRHSCSGHGVCQQHPQNSTASCACTPGWGGEDGSCGERIVAHGALTQPAAFYRQSEDEQRANGVIDADELHAILGKLRALMEGNPVFARGVRPECTQRLLKRFGVGGRMDEVQFANAYAYLKDLAEKFKRIDTDRSRTISPNELIGMLPLPVGDIARVFYQYDVDRSGFIDFGEFVELMFDWDNQSAWAAHTYQRP